MIIFKHISEIKEKLPHPVVTIGNFDGVHLGHREIFRRVKRRAAELGGVSVVITFVPHPLRVIKSSKKLLLINTYEEKELLIEASGIDYLLEIPFDAEFAAISATEFVTGVLLGVIGMESLIIGYDYSFGRNREGNVALMQQLAREHSFNLEVLDPIASETTVFSSTAVRTMIAAGEVNKVVALLGRHYSLGGVVVHGYHRGKGLGFPTANLETDKEIVPRAGVYAVKVKLDEILYDGACNIGTNPTFHNDKQSVEVFLFDFAENIYGRQVRLYFIDRIRDEQEFPDQQALMAAIATDVARCREILNKATIIEYREYLGSC
jgi:riboflavin kinase/FMN adenylyltransferase